MDLSRASTPYFPLHRTQLHPRMYQALPSESPNNNKIQSLSLHNSSNNKKCLLLLAFVFTIPFLFYLFSTAQKVHRSSKFSLPKSQSFSLLLDAGPSASRIRVYELLSDAHMPLILASKKAPPGLAGLQDLVQFAKERVPTKEWPNTKVQLIIMTTTTTTTTTMAAPATPMEHILLESYRSVLRDSGFLFKDEWARLIREEEKGVFAWVAVNYAFGYLGSPPHKTTGVVQLGGSSLQVTFASQEVAELQSLQMIKLAGVTYTLHTQSLPEFGQDAVWDSLHKLRRSRELMSLSSYKVGSAGNPCIPKGFEVTSNVSDAKLLSSHPAGNFTACRLEALSSLKNRQEKCLHAPCKIGSSLSLEIQGKAFSQENWFYTSEYFGLVPRASLLELESAGKRYCDDDWDKLKNQHYGTDDLDLLKYCFSSAYMVALLHDSLGISMKDERIGFLNPKESFQLDWTLGAFILQSMLEPDELEADNFDQIVGNESVTYFSLFAFLLVALLLTFFVLQWRKPQLKTIYDLEKGHYIVTRVPR